MQKEDCYYLGKITKKHGFKGNLILHLETDEPDQYINMESVFIETNGILVPYFFAFIQSYSQGKLLVKFDDISAEDSEKLINKHLYLPLSTLPKLEGNKFYYHEIIGFQVTDVQHGDIGQVLRVIDSGVQPLFEVNFQSQIILIPVVDEWILDVDREKKEVQIQTPEGLIDLYKG